jgi:CDP-diacylglycerol pyrophosphatase
MIGIESSLTLDPPTVDIWQDGWTEARKYPGYPESRTGLAINSAISRNQDQLHIHMSCVNPSVLTLLDNLKEISSDPSNPTLIHITLKKSGNRVSQHNYEAVLLNSLTGNSSPFKKMRQIPHANEHVKDQSFAIVKGRGAQSNNYILLNTYANGPNPGEAEELLDQTCSN